MASVLHTQYKEQIVPELVKKFSYKNKIQAPKLRKIVLNMGLGAAVQEPKYLDQAMEQMGLIAGQKPVATKAKKAEAGFKIREGMKIGCKVTLRGDRMYEFLYKLINVAIPRIKDFRGMPTKSFDLTGNYSVGLQEQIIFPEINPDDVQRSQGMDIIFDIDSKSKEESKALLELMGFPFRKK